MKSFMELVDKILGAFRPKPRKPIYPPQGIIVEEFYFKGDATQYSVGHGGSGGGGGVSYNETVIVVQAPDNVGGGSESNDTPDFSKCQDPEFAKIHYNANKMAAENAKNAMKSLSSGSAGGAGSSSTPITETYPGDISGGNSACTLPIIPFQELVGYCDSTLRPKSKKKLTKKQTATQNAEIMVEILKWSNPFSLRATQLQRLSRIRRERFLPLLKKLVKNGTIARIGTGQRGSPYIYGLPEQL